MIPWSHLPQSLGSPASLCMCRAQSKLKNIRPAVQAIVHLFQRSGRSCKGCKIGKAVFVDHCSSSTLSNAPLRFRKPCISNFVQPLLVNFQTHETHFCRAMRSLQKNAFHKALQIEVLPYSETELLNSSSWRWLGRHEWLVGDVRGMISKTNLSILMWTLSFRNKQRWSESQIFPLHHGQSRKKYVIEWFPSENHDKWFIMHHSLK